jgi:hypothetical protein
MADKVHADHEVDRLARRAHELLRYNHVPSKAALLDGIHERILLDLAPPPPQARTWQSYARHRARALHRALLAHPNAIPLFATRPAATPASIAKLDAYLQVLTDAGFRLIDALSIVQLLAQLVVGHALWVGSAFVAPLTDVPVRDRKLEQVLDEWDPDRELEMGIDALLVGFDARLR